MTRLLDDLDALRAESERLRKAAQDVVLVARKHTPEIIALNYVLGAHPLSQSASSWAHSAANDPSGLYDDNWEPTRPATVLQETLKELIEAADALSKAPVYEQPHTPRSDGGTGFVSLEFVRAMAVLMQACEAARIVAKFHDFSRLRSP